jgi:predicted alpha/beta-hydrolase family hydrolase
MVPPSTAEPITIAISKDIRVSGLLIAPPRPRAAYAFAHGAGAGMAHRFMTNVAEGLAAREVATLRYQFLYMERATRRPDPPKLAHMVVRAAVAEAGRRWPTLPLVAGGKSYGGRMTSQAQAAAPMPGLRGLAFFGFPLHPAGAPSRERGAHLSDVQVPMLFLQGARDALAHLDQIEPLCSELGPRATLKLFADADHSFHVPAKSGSNDAEMMAKMLDAFAKWTDALVAGNLHRSH